MQTDRSLIRFGDALRGKVKAELRGVQAARVEAYDAARQTVSLSFPLPMPVRVVDDGGEEALAFRRQAGVDDVPVLFAGGPAGALTMPIPVGMEGVFIPFEGDHGGYLATGERQAELNSTERHTLGCGGVFVPSPLSVASLAPAAEGATVLSGDDVRLGEAGATEKMARADRAEAQLVALADRVWFLESWCNQLQSWLVLAHPGISAAMVALGGPPAGPLPMWTATVPSPLQAPVNDWDSWDNEPRPWQPGDGDLPTGYAGTGPTGADKVKGV